MAKPSKHPAPAEPSAASANTAPTATASALEQPLTQADFDFLLSLDPHASGDERVRSDMLALLTADETVEALSKYAPALAALGVHVQPSIATVPQIRRLQRLRRRLDLAQAQVTRALQATGAPSQELVSSLHRVLVATPERSPIRVAFSLFLKEWQATFRAPGASAKAEKVDAEKPAAQDKTPPTK